VLRIKAQRPPRPGDGGGVMPPRSGAGEWVSGEAAPGVNSREHGQQFKASLPQGPPPRPTAEGSRVPGFWNDPGIGSRSTPASSWRRSAIQVFEVIEQAPERLREVPGIGPVRGQRISQAWADQKVVREIMGLPATAMVSAPPGPCASSETYGNERRAR